MKPAKHDIASITTWSNELPDAARLDPGQAALFLKSLGAPGSRPGLAVWRAANRGPAYLKVLGRVVYEVRELRRFVREMSETITPGSKAA